MPDSKLQLKPEELSEDDVALAVGELMEFCRQRGWPRTKSVAALNSTAATLRAIMDAQTSAEMTRGMFLRFFGGA